MDGVFGLPLFSHKFIDQLVGFGLIAQVAGAYAVQRCCMAAFGPGQQMVDCIAVLSAEVARIPVPCQDKLAEVLVAVQPADCPPADDDGGLLADERNG
ncbi:hypothetical protein D3C71_1638740 [compost metagenome]